MKRTITLASFVLGAALANAQVENDTLKSVENIEEVQLFGIPKKQPKGLEIITRMPLKPRDQIQSISVISSKVIEDLGGLTVTDVAKMYQELLSFPIMEGLEKVCQSEVIEAFLF